MIQERLIKYIEHKGISKYRFYKETNLSNGFLDKSGTIGVDKCEIIYSLYPDINLEWLITGKGEMLKNNLKPNSEPFKLDLNLEITLLKELNRSQLETIKSQKTTIKSQVETINATKVILKLLYEKLNPKNNSFEEDIKNTYFESFLSEVKKEIEKK